MSDRPQPKPSHGQGTESYPSVSDDEFYGLETTLAGAPTENDLIGQGLPKISLGKNTLYKKGHVSNNTSMTSVQQGKQKVPQKGEASTTEPSAGTSDSRDIPSKGASHVGRKMNNIRRV